jgi:ankyrin repeat protein
MTIMEGRAVIAAVQAGDAERLRTLLAANASWAARDANGVSAIMHALYLRREDLLSLLLATAPALDIFEAAGTGRIERVEELLRSDPAIISQWSADGFTALHFACFFGREEVAGLLLRHGADAAAVARNPMQVTPLHSASAGRNLEIARVLLEHGAPPNARQQQGWTALHSAAQHGDKALVELLLKHGADRFAANDDGVTPAALARKNGHAEIAGLLE